MADKDCIFYNKCIKCNYFYGFGDCNAGVVKPLGNKPCESFDCRYWDSCELARKGLCGSEKK